MEPLATSLIAKLLTEIGERLELAGDSPFKARAYYVAAENLLKLTQPLGELIARGKLRTIPGVGEALAEKIIKLYRTGTHPVLEELRAQMSAGVLELLRVPGLGPKKVALLYQQLQIDSLEQLEKACRDGRLLTCKGMTAKSAQTMLAHLEMLRKTAGCCLLDEAEIQICEALAKLSRSHAQWTRLEPAGAYRRNCEIVDELVLAALDENGVACVTQLGNVRIVSSGAEQFGATWLQATGSDAHLKELSEYAENDGLQWTPQGWLKAGKLLPCPDEESIYAAAELPWIAPELREGRGEVALAARGKLPVLLSDTDLRGVLHSHTNFSDGVQTLAQMSAAVQARGYEYYGVADHSQSAAYAGGMKEDKIRAQHQLADKLNAQYLTDTGGKFRIFKGVESDILVDGSLDYPDDILEQFDFIVASLHSGLTLSRDAQTQRLLKAVSNPFTTILGHVSARLLLKREPVLFDVEAVLKACAQHHVAVEINAHPIRLDLDWRWHQKALEFGCMLCINPDAHAIDQIDLMRFGVKVARKGGVPRERVLNAMNLKDFSDWLEKRKARRNS